MIILYLSCVFFFFFNDTATTEIYTLSLHDALPIFLPHVRLLNRPRPKLVARASARVVPEQALTSDVTHRSEEHTSELQSRLHLVCRLLLEKKKKKRHITQRHLYKPCVREDSQRDHS